MTLLYKGAGWEYASDNNRRCLDYILIFSVDVILSTCGDSSVWFISGSSGVSSVEILFCTLASCTPGVECEAYADIDVNELEKFRQKFPVLNDGDDFSLK